MNYKKKEIIFEAKTLDGETIEFELEDLFGEGNRCDRVFYIGEFNILGANYTVEEVENFSADDLLHYKFDNEYKVIIMD